MESIVIKAVVKSETKIYQIPEFTGENIPLKEAARIMGKDYQSRAVLGIHEVCVSWENGRAVKLN